MAVRGTSPRAWLWVLLWPALAHAQDARLTYQEALSRARTTAPAAALAGSRLEEAQSRRVGAALRWQSNPEFDVAAGPRSGPGAADADVGLRQAFEPRGARAARLAGVDAGIKSAEAGNAVALREAVRDAAIAFLEALYYGERAKILRSVGDVSVDVARAAERRFQAGDVPILDVNLARGAAAKAAAESARADARRQVALGALAERLGLTGTIDPAGRLAEFSRPRDVSALLAGLDDLPDMQRLAAEQLETAADRQVRTTLTRPVFGVSAVYQRDQGANILLGGLSVTLPVFNSGQGLDATTAARARRITLEAQLVRSALDTRVRTLWAAHGTQHTALGAFERDAMPGLDDSESLARRSYEAGQISLAEWLLLRRELLDTRLSHVDLLFSVALAGTELDSVAGVLR